MKLWLGTSGFQYPEWKGKFYPAGLAASQMLAYYAERLSSTEVNYTFRHLPSAKTIQRWDAATPPAFRFSFKAPQRVTHFARLHGCRDAMRVFAEAIEEAGGKTGPVLFQLPPTFAVDLKVLRSFLKHVPKVLRAAFEFRHESWFEDDVYNLLREHHAALCLAESEDLMAPMVATADFGYLRLRREDYTLRRLKRWAEFVEKQNWREVFVYFKHEEQALGPRFAKQFARAFSKLLKGRGSETLQPSKSGSAAATRRSRSASSVPS